MEKDEFVNKVNDVAKRTADAYWDSANKIEINIKVSVNEIDRFEVRVDGFMV